MIPTREYVQCSCLLTNLGEARAALICGVAGETTPASGAFHVEALHGLEVGLVRAFKKDTTEAGKAL